MIVTNMYLYTVKNSREKSAVRTFMKKRICFNGQQLLSRLTIYYKVSIDNNYNDCSVHIIIRSLQISRVCEFVPVLHEIILLCYCIRDVYIVSISRVYYEKVPSRFYVCGRSNLRFGSKYLVTRASKHFCLQTGPAIDGITCTVYSTKTTIIIHTYNFN